jgi:ornithine cyclodeaminase
MKIITLEQIKAALPSVDLMGEIEAGFVAYSKGKAVVPPVGELVLTNPPGEVHIKYGYLSDDDYYVIKIASGFYENPKLNLPSSNGLMLLFSQNTGELVAVLLDEGYLTDIRTAVAGAIAAKYLAPANVERIGIVGTGMQAKLQLEYLAPVTDCRDVLVWGRDEKKLATYQSAMAKQGFNVTATTEAGDVLKSCNLIVTTTPAESPILNWTDDLQHGVHITAMGSDTESKQELDAMLLRNADLVVADSISQCLERGEIHQALKVDAIVDKDIVELGNIISGDAVGRTSDDQITVADLTGVAVQDIQITKAVFSALDSGN